MPETTLRQSTIVQYLPILDLILLSDHKSVLFKRYKNSINYFENGNLHSEELDEKLIRDKWQENWKETFIKVLEKEVESLQNLLLSAK